MPPSADNAPAQAAATVHRALAPLEPPRAAAPGGARRSSGAVIGEAPSGRRRARARAALHPLAADSSRRCSRRDYSPTMIEASLPAQRHPELVRDRRSTADCFPARRPAEIEALRCARGVPGDYELEWIRASRSAARARRSSHRSGDCERWVDRGEPGARPGADRACRASPTATTLRQALRHRRRTASSAARDGPRVASSPRPLGRRAASRSTTSTAGTSTCSGTTSRRRLTPMRRPRALPRGSLLLSSSPRRRRRAAAGATPLVAGTRRTGARCLWHSRVHPWQPGSGA